MEQVILQSATPFQQAFGLCLSGFVLGAFVILWACLRSAGDADDRMEGMMHK